MPVPSKALPFGMRDIKVRPINAAGTVGASVDLPVARTLSFEEAEDFTELRGDDGVVAIRGAGPAVNFELEEGGIDLAAYAVMAGGTVTVTGTTPNEKRTYNKKTTDSRPYFQ